MSATTRSARWSPTSAHMRAVVVAAAALVVGVLMRHADVLAFTAPFLAAATWGALQRPATAAVAGARVEAATLFEGQRTVARYTVGAEDGGESGIDIVTFQFDPDRFTQLGERTRARVVAADDGEVALELDVRALRWGRRSLATRTVVCTSALGAYRTANVATPTLRMATLPLRENFVAVDSIPRPAGIVGPHHSRRTGDGSELAEVRPFRPGDRLRRINWPVSSRTGELHVTATWSDRDTEVMLLLDTEHDYGDSEGIDGTASSLDTSVRGAAAIAEHYLRHGDRVSLVDLGERVRHVPAGGGRGHLRRILDALVAATAKEMRGFESARRQRPLRSGDLVIALTPLTGTVAANQVVQLVQRGRTVIVIDTLPEGIAMRPGTPPWRSLAWRYRLTERAVEIDRLGDLGVPVVVWRGSGSLDEVLRRVSRMNVVARVHP